MGQHLRGRMGIRVVQQVFHAGDTVFAPTLDPSLSTVKGYGARRGNGYGVLLINLDQSTAITTTFGITNDARTFTASIMVYGKAQYDNSQNNVWSPPTTQSLGSVNGSFAITLAPWSITAITLQ
jgi:hypothetical protein